MNERFINFVNNDELVNSHFYIHEETLSEELKVEVFILGNGIKIISPTFALDDDSFLHTRENGIDLFNIKGNLEDRKLARQ